MKGQYRWVLKVFFCLFFTKVARNSQLPIHAYDLNDCWAGVFTGDVKYYPEPRSSSENRATVRKALFWPHTVIFSFSQE